MCMFVYVSTCVHVCVCVCVCVCGVFDDDDDDDDDALSAGSCSKVLQSCAQISIGEAKREAGSLRPETAKPVCACVNAVKLLSCLLEYVVEEDQEGSWVLRCDYILINL
jgi:hypothetical protein